MIKMIKKYQFHITYILLICLLPFYTKAQDVSVKAKLDTTEFLIGDQVGLELEVKQPVKEFVGIPTFDQEISKQVEVLDQSANDTSLLESGYYIIKKRLLITSFDSGYYALRPIPFLYHNDTLKTDTLFFTVHTVAVDTTKEIKDIKMPYRAPLSFAEVLPWAGLGLVGILIILIVIYIIRKIKRKEPILRRIRPKQPAHIIAYRELSKLKDDKLWQKDLIKDYYTVLTDILRKYLWNRYSIRTLERTSEEILQSLKESDFKDDDAYNTLKDIFYVSDLVKFAKFKPLADEHIKCMDGAYYFVDKTKLIVEENIEQDKTGENTEDEIVTDSEDENVNKESEKKDELENTEEKQIS